MNMTAFQWALHQRVASQSAKLVLLVLAESADSRNESAVRIKRLAEKSLVSERTVQRCLKQLEECGLIRRFTQASQEGTQLENIYQLQISLSSHDEEAL